MSETPHSPRRFVRFSASLLVLNCIVILGGAFVRASGSGDGCGTHWPLCQGALVPAKTAALATWIELSHRITSGLSLLAATLLFFYARKLFGEIDLRRRAAKWIFLLTLVEAGIGAILVLLSLVNQNASLLRILVVGAHLANTFFLLAACTLCLWASLDKQAAPFSLRSFLAHRLSWALLGLLITAALGSMAAVGDFLYPAASVLEGVSQDFNPNAPLFVRLRILHPIAALLLASFLLQQCISLLGSSTSKLSSTYFWAKTVIVLLLCQLCIGLATILLGSPYVLQLAHVAFADLIWIACIWMLANETLRRAENPH